MSAPDFRAVFLSYAHEDAAAAQRIAEALRSNGVEVWFDQSELRGGDAWDQKIRKQIHECALFLPVVSAHTQERGEGYFRREWKLAVERTHDMAEGVPFLVPVAVDETPETAALVPEPFTHVQWTRLPGALPTPQFVEQVKRLLAAPRTPAALTSKTEAESHLPAPSSHQGFPMRTVIALGVVVFALVAYIVMRPPAKEAAAPAAPLVNDKSIAVLPFENQSEDQENSAFFADGIHDDVLTTLQSIREMRVVSRTSVMSYRGTTKKIRDIAQELGVAYILEGSVRRAGNTVRVTGQLIDARTDAHLWAKKYDRELRDIFAIQSELAQAIAGELKAALSPQEKSLVERLPTENPTAYDLFLKARDVHNREGIGRMQLQKQESLLQSAVTLDPKFAGAWALLAYTHGLIYGQNFEHTEARRAKAKAALDAAMRLAPEAPETIRELGDFRLDVLRDCEGAIESYEQLARLQPNNPHVAWSLGDIRAMQGRWAEAAALLRKATQLDPGGYSYAQDLQSLLRGCRRYDEAIAEQRRFLTTIATGFDRRRALALLTFAARGSTKETDDFFAALTEAGANTPQAVAARKEWAQTRGDFAEAIRLDRLLPYNPGSTGVLTLESEGMQALGAALTLAATGDMAGARARLEDVPAKFRAQLKFEPENPTLWSYVGMMEALLGNKEAAVHSGRKAVELKPESASRRGGVSGSYTLALIFAWTGDKDRALAELSRLMRSEFYPPGISVYHLKYGPWAWPLHGDPRWEALLNDPQNNAPLF